MKLGWAVPAEISIEELNAPKLRYCLMYSLCILCQVLEKAKYSMKRTFELPWSLPNPDGNYSRESEG